MTRSALPSLLGLMFLQINCSKFLDGSRAGILGLSQATSWALLLSSGMGRPSVSPDISLGSPLPSLRAQEAAEVGPASTVQANYRMEGCRARWPYLCC